MNFKYTADPPRESNFRIGCAIPLRGRGEVGILIAYLIWVSMNVLVMSLPIRWLASLAHRSAKPEEFKRDPRLARFEIVVVVWSYTAMMFCDIAAMLILASRGIFEVNVIASRFALSAMGVLLVGFPLPLVEAPRRAPPVRV